jgi:hypothetical protein
MLKMVQGVREVFDITDAPKSNDNPSFDEGKIVLIGRGISHLNFKDSYLSIVNPAWVWRSQFFAEFDIVHVVIVASTTPRYINITLQS